MSATDAARKPAHRSRPVASSTVEPRRPRFGRRVVRAALVVAIASFFVLAGLALHFAAPKPQIIADTIVAVWLLAGIVVAARVRPFGRALLATAALVALLLAWWASLRPRNDRDWLPDV